MKKSCLLLLITALLPHSFYGQEKVVTAATQTKTIFSLPKGENMEKLTDLDLARMEVKETKERRETVIDKSELSIEITVTDLTKHEYLSDYRHGIETTVLNGKGVELYDYDGKQAYTQMHESPDDALLYFLPGELYPGYGFYNEMFKIDISEITKQYLSLGYSVAYSPKDSIFQAGNDSISQTVNFKDLYYETIFFENGEIKYIDYKYYISDGSYIVPYSESSSSFEYTQNGIKIMRTIYSLYLEYSVVEDGKAV